MIKNNKGFVLVETLVVSVAIAAIFSVIYTNIVPVLGEYEKTENYDDLDTKYVAHWMRMLIINKGNRTLAGEISSTSYSSSGSLPSGRSPLSIEVDKTVKPEDSNYENKRYSNVTSKCSIWFTEPNTCINFFKQFNVTKLYIVPYNIENFKKYVKNNLGQSPGIQEYVNSLSKFSKDTAKQNYYRLIVEVERNTNLKETEDYFTTYATIELNRGVLNVLQNRP